MYVEDKAIGEAPPKEAPPKLDEIGKTLLAAADLIEKNGWCQRGFFHGERSCALGAIRRVTHLRHNHDNYYSATVRLEIQIGMRSVGAWNDQPERTQEEVIAALRKAAYYVP
jgi:hypothetical protein